MSGDSAFHLAPHSAFPWARSSCAVSHLAGCAELLTRSREVPSGPQRMLVITPRRKLPNFPFPREAVGRKRHALFDPEKEEMGQSNSSVHTRESSSCQQYPMCNSVSPLFGVLVYQALPSSSVFLCTLSLSLSTTVLPSPWGVCPHLLGSPGILGGETSWTCSLFPYRNFVFPHSKIFPWKCSCNQSFHPQSNMYLFH